MYNIHAILSLTLRYRGSDLAKLTAYAIVVTLFSVARPDCNCRRFELCSPLLNGRGKRERTNAQEKREREGGRETVSVRGAAAFLPVLRPRRPRARMRRVFSGSGQPRRPPDGREGREGGERAAGVARQTATDRTQKILRRRRRRQRELNGREGGGAGRGGAAAAAA